jgi:hypothetical protein
MAVYTEVSFDEAAELFARLDTGALTALQPITSGIENTNYFADTANGRYVLTLFERLTHEQLPFYLQLMKHLPTAAASSCTRWPASRRRWSTGCAAATTSRPMPCTARWWATCSRACTWRPPTSRSCSPTCEASPGGRRRCQ